MTHRVNPASEHRFIANPLGLVSQNAPTHIRDKLERPTLRGCSLAPHYGRVVASLQHLPCQRTKPKGLFLYIFPYRSTLNTCYGIWAILRPKSHNHRALSPTNNPHSTLSTIKMSITRPTLRNFHPIYSANNPIGVSLLAGQG